MTRGLCAARPDPKELAAFGLTEDDIETPDIEVWPDNIAIVEAYCAMRTQWRFADFGPIGLDYSSLPVVLRMLGLARKEWADIFEGIRLMEATELQLMRAERKA